MFDFVGVLILAALTSLLGFLTTRAWRLGHPVLKWGGAFLAGATAQAPAAGTPAYGKYMVDVTGCQLCHGPQLQGKVDNGQPGPLPGPNLTKIVPAWTEAQFMTFFNTGQMPGGGQVPTVTLASGFTEPRMPWNIVRAVATDDELKAMYAYLHALAPMDGPAQ